MQAAVAARNVEKADHLVRPATDSSVGVGKPQRRNQNSSSNLSSKTAPPKLVLWSRELFLLIHYV